MEALVRGENDGAAIVATTATPVSIDLTDYAGRYVKIWGDQDFRFVFRPDATPTFNNTVPAAVGSANIPDEVAAGVTGVQRVVTTANPHLTLQGISMDSTVKIKPTSEKVGP